VDRLGGLLPGGDHRLGDHRARHLAQGQPALLLSRGSDTLKTKGIFKIIHFSLKYT
jgi:hypothetical protein